MSRNGKKFSKRTYKKRTYKKRTYKKRTYKKQRIRRMKTYKLRGNHKLRGGNRVTSTFMSGFKKLKKSFMPSVSFDNYILTEILGIKKKTDKVCSECNKKSSNNCSFCGNIICSDCKVNHTFVFQKSNNYPKYHLPICNKCNTWLTNNPIPTNVKKEVLVTPPKNAKEGEKFQFTMNGRILKVTMPNKVGTNNKISVMVPHIISMNQLWNEMPPKWLKDLFEFLRDDRAVELDDQYPKTLMKWIQTNLNDINRKIERKQEAEAEKQKQAEAEAEKQEQAEAEAEKQDPFTWNEPTDHSHINQGRNESARVHTATATANSVKAHKKNKLNSMDKDELRELALKNGLAEDVLNKALDDPNWRLKLVQLIMESEEEQREEERNNRLTEERNNRLTEERNNRLTALKKTMGLTED